jgi:foldase protein PrsA
MKALRIVLVAALAAALAIGAAGCTDKNVAAKVNGDPITIEELNVQVEQLKVQYPQMFEGADGEGRLLDFKQRLLDNLINQKLIEQASKEKKIEVTDADVKKQVDQLKSGFKDDAQFQDALKSAGMDADGLSRQIKEQLVTQKLIETLSKDTSITVTDMQAYYDKNKTQFEQKAAKRAVHILFKPEDKATATKVLEQIKDGGDFAALAKQHSVDTATASKGGDLGWPTTPYVDEFEAALAKLKKGQTSGLVQTPYGWHIIRVTETRTGSQQKFDQVKSQIEQILVQQERAEAYQKFLDELKKKAKIEILIEELKAGAAGSTGSTTSTSTK